MSAHPAVHPHAETFPKPALIAAAVMLTVTVAGAGAGRLAHLHAPPTSAAARPAPLASADLRFSDEPDGSIRITDPRSGAVVSTVAPGSGGFVRGVMRGLARERISRRIGSAPPFRLALGADRRLTLTDLATGRVIDLQAFGQSNRAAFLPMLPPGGRRA